MSTLAVPVTCERAARHDLRAQIARLARRLAAHPVTSRGPSGRPRILGLAELEALRDDLAARVASAERLSAAGAVGQAAAREQLEAMRSDPRAHRHIAIALHDLGLPGCGVYRARPRLGLVGRLAGWWEITLSSGCP